MWTGGAAALSLSAASNKSSQSLVSQVLWPAIASVLFNFRAYQCQEFQVPWSTLAVHSIKVLSLTKMSNSTAALSAGAAASHAAEVS